MPAELYLARRYFWDHRHGIWSALLSGIPIGSVALGVAALIITLAIMTGFREDIQTKMLGVNPHLYITSPIGEINPNSSTLKEKLDKNLAIQSWSPFISGEVLIGRGPQTSGASIKGVDPEKEPLIANLAGRLTEGKWPDLKTVKISKGGEIRRVFLGQELARKLGARTGDKVWTITPGSLDITSFTLPRAHQFIVSGYIETGLYDYDSVIAYTDIPSAQKLFGMDGMVSGIGVRLKNPEGVDKAAKFLQMDLNGVYWVRSWLALNKNLFAALKLEKTVMFLVQALITLVAAFMIVSNLLLKTIQKTKDIGILRAMGATPRTIHNIFLLQGFLMGFIGCVIGVFIGIGGSLLLAKTNFIRLPADVYYIDHVPIRLDFTDIISVVGLAVAIIILASLYPAWRASKQDPLDAIRYG